VRSAGPRALRAPLGALLWSLAMAAPVSAQDVEPRRWTPLPVGTNVVSVALAHTDGRIYADPVMQITDAKVEARTYLLSYLYAFDLLGRSARIDVHLPQREARWRGQLDGESRSVGRSGPGDPRVRLSVNLVGGPALGGAAFRAYTASHPVNTIVGAALAVTLPLGEYMKDKLLNLGENRFVVRPELGVVQTWGAWSCELTGSAYLFTDNDAYRGDRRRAQDPLYALQTHLVRTFAPGWWASLSAEYAGGGESRVEGVRKSDRRGDLLYGVSLGLPLNRQSSVKIAYVGSRTQKDIGGDTENLAIAYSFRF
jgi:hypothetical protein